VSLRATLATLALSLAAALAGTPLFLRVARRWGLLDRPNARSAHRDVTPRGGGLVVLAAAALACAAFGPWPLTRAQAAVIAGALLMALVGLLDDRLALSVAPKALLQLAVATGVVWAGDVAFTRAPLPPPLDAPLGVLAGVATVAWIVVVVNFYNFLDGIDGLAAVQGVITGAGIALAGWDGAASAGGAALAGACLGFLFFNWSPARVFLGDTGSALLGFTFAALPLLASPAARAPAVFFAALSLWLFLADAAWTLGRRLVLGQDVLAAHREHVYQRLVDRGLAHADVALGVGAGSALLTVLALLAWRTSSAPLGWSALAAGAVLFALELLALRRRDGGKRATDTGGAGGASPRPRADDSRGRERLDDAQRAAGATL
jgi:UDP-N-acetylmuramyl pentapeptide phosphotransferase/UDP-N-acetylglucosamine-1-phosphate transferase